MCDYTTDTMAANNRLTQAAHIIDGFHTVMRAHRKEVQIVVTTAQPLDSSSETAIKKQLKQFVQKGETLVLDTKVDSNLLGGLVVEIGDNRVDLSIATRIKNVCNELRASI
ncbi:ATP synthase F1, delta subunit [Sphaeroforma arctica JP610]|uniref:ATP synthase F1, delta subunit n=1 Tax=Sphaeroforma arctica JP610 TaxID=667725 RepID=A0A0L0FAW2_9EUKA|nr:ATP synthase F1, delta subunit [Sphaeroforma arctica JP610]KNC73884.1 ATP synthase F1, delta subunit [Sphaeroforma arctica JP610]|eukprot:XP_014147786.1 ATP synthase F1, delta subunit [Sphaeroforma arctica JP610]